MSPVENIYYRSDDIKKKPKIFLLIVFVICEEYTSWSLNYKYGIVALCQAREGSINMLNVIY